jgi:hypothetical protein
MEVLKTNEAINYRHPVEPTALVEVERLAWEAGSKRLSSFDSKSCRDCSSSRTRIAQSSLRRHQLRHHWIAPADMLRERLARLVHRRPPVVSCDDGQPT